MTRIYYDGPVSDAQIRALRSALLSGPADDRQLEGLVACHDALGRSHRRSRARALCATLIAAASRAG